MLQTLFPLAYARILALPMLGAIAEGYNDWLISNGYTNTSREAAIRMLPHVDAALRKRHKGTTLASLSRTTFQVCWHDVMKVFSDSARIVRSLERYLTVTGILPITLSSGPATASSALTEEYLNYLREVRGFSEGTLLRHHNTSRSFLDRLEAQRVPLDSLQAAHVESYISHAGKRISRATLQHDVAVVRGLLRFLAANHKVPLGLGRRDRFATTL